MSSFKMLAALLGLLQLTAALSPDPGEGKMYLGFWPDLSDGVLDTPGAANARFGVNYPIFQMAQSIPTPAYDYTTGAGGEALFSEVDATATDAAYFLTVYPDTDGGMDAVEDSDLVALGEQIRKYQSQGRTVFLRWAPEMNGPFKTFGMQPTAYKALWERMYTIVKQVAPDTTIVWAPNTSYGYPSGATLSDAADEDQDVLDTNGNGELDSDDDAYAPYYPGDDFVDQAGMSLYYKGPGFQNENEAQPGGFCAHLLDGEDPFYSESYTPFYATYCDEAERACILTESGAAYHVNVTDGDSQLDIQSAWVNDCLANATFFDDYPWVRHIQMFEHAKSENDGGVQDYRDFRVTNQTNTINMFQQAVAALSDRYIWANSTLDDSTSANTEIPTTPASSPNVESTTTMTVTLSSLSGGEETVTATVTEYETPSYSGGLANEVSDAVMASSDEEGHRLSGDEDSAGVAFTATPVLASLVAGGLAAAMTVVFH